MAPGVGVPEIPSPVCPAPVVAAPPVPPVPLLYAFDAPVLPAPPSPWDMFGHESEANSWRAKDTRKIEPSK